MGHGLRHSALVLADAGEGAGLGHISRSSAVAVALQTRGFRVECRAHGALEPFVVDDLEWTPVASLKTLAGERPPVLLLDSYRLGADDARAVVDPTTLIVMHDAVGYPESADLVVALSPPDTPTPNILGGSRYACLRPEYWGLPTREPAADPLNVLVAAGAAGAGISILADAARAALPDARVQTVRGPFDTTVLAEDIETIKSPASLLMPLLNADLVVTAAGQTLLEAVATGAPTVGVALADNQRRQLAHLAALGAVEPAETGDLVERIRDLGSSLERRRSIARAAQSAIDGFGALRVAFAVEAASEGSWS